MPIKVDNLDNLFWDNGSWKYPNTYPHLINGKYLNVTPVMTSPLTGWIVIEGDFNYAEFNNELFFLRKDKQISRTKNKWRYILVKDQLCTLFRNKANIIAQGSLINADLNHLKPNDFLFTFPLFNNFNKRILLPLTEGLYNWKTHVIPVPISKHFNSWNTTGDKEFTQFIDTLEANKTLFHSKPLTELLKDNKYFSLLGVAGRSKKDNNYKNELVIKINQFLQDLKSENVMFGKIQASSSNALPKMRDKYALSYIDHSLIAAVEENKQITQIDLSTLTDIQPISMTRGREEGGEDIVLIPITLNYNQSLLDDLESATSSTYVKKLARRVRVPFLNKYSTRSIFKTGEHYYTWYLQGRPHESLFYPQKVFFKMHSPLKPKAQYSRDFLPERLESSFRSVYLYYCYNLDFVFTFAPKVNKHHDSYPLTEKNFIDPKTYFTDLLDIRKDLSINLLYSNYEESGTKPLQISHETTYNQYYPWGDGGYLHSGEHLNIGWLIGQFSPYLQEQTDKLDPNFPYIIKKDIQSLKRIKGLNPIVQQLIQNDDVYEIDKHYSKDQLKKDTLNLFNILPARARQATLEEDFLIGEKLLFTTWGMAPYLLFQPANTDSAQSYSYYEFANLDRGTSKAAGGTLIGNWLKYTSWWYSYYVFDDGTYLLDTAKKWMKKAYDNFKPIDYKRFYESSQNYQELKTHIQKNSQAYFISEQVQFSNTPLRELKTGDIFYSDLEWFFFDQSENPKFLHQEKSDWWNYSPDLTVQLAHEDVIVFTSPKDQKLHLGKVSVWEDKVTLPNDQFIAIDNHINDSSSNTNQLPVKYTKISTLHSFDSFDELIRSLKTQSISYFLGHADFSLADLADKGGYLFDLVGTNFYCFLDDRSRVHLIFKDETYISIRQDKLYTIQATEQVAELTKSQWVNQKVNLSIYGSKIELPIKAINGDIKVTIKIGTADLGSTQKTIVDSHKVEVVHSLGTMYFRLDIPKLLPDSQINLDAFRLEEVNIQHKRTLEDYLIKRKQYTIDNEQMNISHEQTRLQMEVDRNQAIIDTVFSVAGLAVTGVTKMMGLPLWTVGFGLKGSLSRTTTNIHKLAMMPSRHALQERAMEEAAREKALQSYTIDLNFQREKWDHLWNLRKMFAYDSYSEATSRERNKALDKLEDKQVDEIYLELWTTSQEQEHRINDYLNKFGVDSRVPNVLLSVKNGIEVGNYKMEDVELTNLKDRIDYLFLKARLENGIKFVDWKEHEKIKELIPVDPRITKLQAALKLAERKQIDLEQDLTIQKSHIEDLQAELDQSKDEVDELHENVTELTKNVAEGQTQIKQLQTEVEREKQNVRLKDSELQTKTSLYSQLSNSYREKEKEITELKNLNILYKAESNKAKEISTKSVQELEECKKAKQKAEETNKQVQADNERILETLKLEKEKVTTLEASLNLEKTQKKSLETSLQTANTEKAKLQEEREQCKSAIQTCQTVSAQTKKVFELIKQKDAEINQLKTGAKIAIPTGYVSLLLNASCCSETNKIGSTMLVVKTKKTDYEILEWNNISKCFKASGEGNTRDRIYRYTGYALYTIAKDISGEHNGGKDFIGGYWASYRFLSYFSEKITNWAMLENRIIGITGCCLKRSVKFINKEDWIPYWTRDQKGVIADETPVANSNDGMEDAGVFWHPGNKHFQKWKPADNTGIPIKTYGDYRRVLGLDQPKEPEEPKPTPTGEGEEVGPGVIPPPPAVPTDPELEALKAQEELLEASLQHFLTLE